MLDDISQSLAGCGGGVLAQRAVALESVQECTESVPDERNVPSLRGTAKAQLRFLLHAWSRSKRYAIAASRSSNVLKARARPAYCTIRANCGVQTRSTTGIAARSASTQNRSSSVNAMESAYVTSERSTRTARSAFEYCNASRICFLRPISSSPLKRIVLIALLWFTPTCAARLR